MRIVAAIDNAMAPVPAIVAKRRAPRGNAFQRAIQSERACTLHLHVQNRLNRLRETLRGRSGNRQGNVGTRTFVHRRL